MVVLISTESYATLVNVIQIENDKVFDSLITYESYVIISWKSGSEQTTSSITEYSLVDLNNIDVLNSYEVYNYTLYFDSNNKLIYSISNSTGLFTILARKNKDLVNMYLLVYKSNVPNI